MPKISIVINVDSRPQNDKAEQMFSGTCNWDFWVAGVLNKIKFFQEYEKEVILHGDVHENVPREKTEQLQEICDTLVLREHTNELNFNDWSYYRALSLASGDIVVHMIQSGPTSSQQDGLQPATQKLP